MFLISQCNRYIEFTWDSFAIAHYRVQMGGKKKTYVMSYECCHGFQRVPGQGGCPRGNKNSTSSGKNSLKCSKTLRFILLLQFCAELNLKDITETVQEVGAVEFSKVLESMGLDQMLDQANYTIFAPTDEKFKQYEPPRVRVNYHFQYHYRRVYSAFWREQKQSGLFYALCVNITNLRSEVLDEFSSLTFPCFLFIRTLTITSWSCRRKLCTCHNSGVSYWCLTSYRI